MFDHKFRHFPDLPVLRGFVCIEPKGLPTTYQKISIVTKWGFFVTKFVMGGLGPKKFSTFGPSDASRKKTIKFHLMQAIAFYSPCFCLSNRVWHEQIVLCTIVTDPNNFKCHETIFAIFWRQKTHYFLERTHQNLTHRMHDATHWDEISHYLNHWSTKSIIASGIPEPQWVKHFGSIPNYVLRPVGIWEALK